MSALEMIPDDKTLFHRIQSGDQEAFDQFYRRHFDDLYRAAFRRLPDKEACKDILQDVFMDCWNRRGQISNDNPVAYLHTAVKFRVFKFASKSDRLSFYEPFEAMGLTASAATDNLYYKELERLVDLWMETLPEKRREIFRLHYKENLSTQMIADKLAISRKTVQNQLGIVFSDLRNQMPDMILILLLVYLFYV